MKQLLLARSRHPASSSVKLYPACNLGRPPYRRDSSAPYVAYLSPTQIKHSSDNIPLLLPVSINLHHPPLPSISLLPRNPPPQSTARALPAARPARYHPGSTAPPSRVRRQRWRGEHNAHTTTREKRGQQCGATSRRKLKACPLRLPHAALLGHLQR